MTQNYKVVLVDDHLLIRDALAEYIDKFDEISVIGRAADGKELVKLIQDGGRPQLIVLDLNMPVMDGYETAIWLRENHPEVKILVLTMYDSEIALIRLLQVGVRGFLKKDVHPSELKRALLAVAEDGYYYSHSTTGKLASLFQRRENNADQLAQAMLSDLEISFLKMASTDLTYKEIAEKMKLSPRAVDGYRDNLFEKLAVKSRVGLVLFAIKNGIVNFT